MVLELEGRSIDFFRNEVGIHRWMRVPETEKRGRVHTSSVSVALVDELQVAPRLDKKEVREWITRGTGPGGQHRNKVETCVHLLHVPTGTKVMCQDTRSKEDNRTLAWSRMEERIAALHKAKAMDDRSASRLGQVGHGGRLEKRRTYRERENLVVDHQTERTSDVKSWLRGRIAALHPRP